MSGNADRFVLNDPYGVVPTGYGVILRSLAGLFEIRDLQLAELWKLLAGRLDGRLTGLQIEAEFPEQLQPAIRSLIDILLRLQVVSTCSTAIATSNECGETSSGKECDGDAPASDLIWLLGSPKALAGATAQLADSVSSRLNWTALVHEDGASVSDAALAAALESGRADCLRRSRAAKIDMHAALSWGAFEVKLATSAPALIICLWPADALAAQLRLAKLGQRCRVPILYGSAVGQELSIGPYVKPGESACWNCARLRGLGNTLVETPLAYRRQQALFDLDPLLALHVDVPASEMLGALVAARIDKTEAISNAVKMLNLQTLRGEHHPIIRLPRCDVCTSEAGGVEIVAGTADINAHSGGASQVADALSDWIDLRFGVIQSVRVAPSISGGAIGLPWVAEAAVGSFVDDTTGPYEAARSWGKGITQADAITGALGEAVERYAAARVPLERLKRARLADLTGDAIDPASLGSYSAAQYSDPTFPFVPLEAGSDHDWIRGTWLHSGQPVWMPALPTFYSAGSFPTEKWIQVTSSGLALGVGWEDAALRATLELVERHTCMASWVRRLPATRLEWQTPEEEARAILDFLRSLGASVEFYLLHAGIEIPTVLCLAVGDGQRWPAVTASAAADLSISAALRRALLEQGLTGPSLRESMLRGEAASIASASDVRTFRDHALYFTHLASLPILDFIRLSPGKEIVDEQREEVSASLATCRERLARSRFKVALADLTGRDLASTPLRVVRAMAAGTQPLYCGVGRQCVAADSSLHPDVQQPEHFVHPFC